MHRTITCFAIAISCMLSSMEKNGFPIKTKNFQKLFLKTETPDIKENSFISLPGSLNLKQKKGVKSIGHALLTQYREKNINVLALHLWGNNKNIPSVGTEGTKRVLLIFPDDFTDKKTFTLMYGPTTSDFPPIEKQVHSNWPAGATILKKRVRLDKRVPTKHGGHYLFYTSLMQEAISFAIDGKLSRDVESMQISRPFAQNTSSLPSDKSLRRKCFRYPMILLLGVVGLLHLYLITVQKAEKVM